MDKENSLFIRIETPTEFRKILLSSIRELIHSLQRNENVKRIRIEKAEQTMKLKKLTKEIEVIMGRIKNSMPSTIEKKKKEQKTKTTKKASIKNNNSKPTKESNEMQKLEDQLKDIENKLKNM